MALVIAPQVQRTNCIERVFALHQNLSECVCLQIHATLAQREALYNRVHLTSKSQNIEENTASK